MKSFQKFSKKVYQMNEILFPKNQSFFFRQTIVPVIFTSQLFVPFWLFQCIISDQNLQ